MNISLHLLRIISSKYKIYFQMHSFVHGLVLPLLTMTTVEGLEELC